ncbi:uncharacterized protein L969DRAFT_20301 [Mixia osmundae IAM 14324]|uniref:Pantoate--beta-alanine ligase n=1 Tax=Mixia osmundae (strain CBS 9802 / IAM 14324 / JCM 22182 / KY 12970) TaxID=764103 RepID=G7EB58_MIXOS|nr:uncharacterized protein L969DRAFT_20301 [Mixia osmundae IAM 14324]KEI36564.1 hypothetical protein L969DRAFT_20301 [Mixia osmundae IAM 14324]GAB00069.1 hypothetical protein E5Q_06771 [Mixia osmundae IAM 14324]
MSRALSVLRTVAEVRAWRSGRRTCGFVPTMGALHAGHIDLVRRATAENENVIVSIFVNPAQFAPSEDLSTYPSTLTDDMDHLRKLPVDALFLPDVDVLYPSGIVQDVERQVGTFVDVQGYSNQMEGRSRPTFFRGVATVVLKLFNIVQPTRAYFGQKDIQQAILLRQMLRDLHLAWPTPANLIISPTTRHESTGLALSSRNAYLSANELEVSPILNEVLRLTAHAIETGQSVEEALAEGLSVFARTSEAARARHVTLRPDYLILNDPQTLQPLSRYDPARGAVLSGACWLGKTRLIDNILLGQHGLL